MTKILVLGAGLMLLVIGFFAFRLPKTPTPPTQNATARYLEFSPELFAQSTSKRRVLYFYASWCPTCRPTDAAFKANSDQIPPDVVVLRVNYSDTDTDLEEKKLADTYGITYQHTFIQIDAQGKPVATWNGGDIATLLANLK